jgi:hypothetical protein
MTDTSRTVRIVPGSSSSFLCPPGHPDHHHHVEAGPRRDPNLIAGLEYALDNEYDDVPKGVQDKARELFDNAELLQPGRQEPQRQRRGDPAA